MTCRHCLTGEHCSEGQEIGTFAEGCERVFPSGCGKLAAPVRLHKTTSSLYAPLESACCICCMQPLHPGSQARCCSCGGAWRGTRRPRPPRPGILAMWSQASCLAVPLRQNSHAARQHHGLCRKFYLRYAPPL
jgi:hypothetical protein